MESLGKIIAAEALADRLLRVVWDDGASANIDFDDLIRTRRQLAPLADKAEFSNVRVSADGWSLEWPSGIDFGASQLRHWAKAAIAENVSA